MKTQFIITENNVNFLFNLLDKENYKHTSVTNEPYSNEAIKKDVKDMLFKDAKKCIGLYYLELNEKEKTYTIFVKFYQGNKTLLEVIKNLKIDKEL